jgi:hypothetical protein
MSTALEIPRSLDRRPLVWTYTMLQTYRDVCPHQADRRFVARTIPFHQTPQMKWGADVHDAMELRLTGGKPLPENMQQWEPLAAQYKGQPVRAEARLAVDRDWNPVDYFGKTVRGRGRADIAIVGEDSAYLGDWKTGKVREDIFELRVQAALLQAKYPHITRIMGQYIWLQENAPGPLHDLSDTDTTMNEVDALVALIEQDRAIGHFEKKRGPLCKGWCPVENCEHWRPRQ